MYTRTVVLALLVCLARAGQGTLSFATVPRPEDVSAGDLARFTRCITSCALKTESATAQFTGAHLQYKTKVAFLLQYLRLTERVHVQVAPGQRK